MGECRDSQDLDHSPSIHHLLCKNSSMSSTTAFTDNFLEPAQKAELFVVERIVVRCNAALMGWYRLRMFMKNNRRYGTEALVLLTSQKTTAASSFNRFITKKMLLIHAADVSARFARM